MIFVGGGRQLSEVDFLNFIKISPNCMNLKKIEPRGWGGGADIPDSR